MESVSKQTADFKSCGFEEPQPFVRIINNFYSDEETTSRKAKTERSTSAETPRDKSISITISNESPSLPPCLPTPDEQSQAINELSLSSFAILPPPLDFADYSECIKQPQAISNSDNDGLHKEEMSADCGQSNSADFHHLSHILKTIDSVRSTSNIIPNVIHSMAMLKTCGQTMTTQSSNSDVQTDSVSSELINNAIIISDGNLRMVQPHDASKEMEVSPRICWPVTHIIASPNLCIAIPQMTVPPEKRTNSSEEKIFDGGKSQNILTPTNDKTFKSEYKGSNKKSQHAISILKPQGSEAQAHNKYKFSKYCLLGSNQKEEPECQIKHANDRSISTAHDWSRSQALFSATTDEAETLPSNSTSETISSGVGIITPPNGFTTQDMKNSGLKKGSGYGAAPTNFNWNFNSTPDITQNIFMTLFSNATAEKTERDALADGNTHNNFSENSSDQLGVNSVITLNGISTDDQLIPKSIIRPKYPPPKPPSEPKTEAAARGEYENVDRISLCQYNCSPKVSVKEQIATTQIKTSTAKLMDGTEVGAQSSLRPEPPRRSCSIPRKSSYKKNVSGTFVEDKLSESHKAQFNASLDHIPAIFAGNKCFLNSYSMRTLKSKDICEPENKKPTAQIRPNAIRSVSLCASVCDTKQSVESLIQHYNQKDKTSTDIIITMQSYSKYSASKFGSLKGKLKDYVSTSNNKKQSHSYSSDYKNTNTASMKEKLGGKQSKYHRRVYETRPADYNIQDEDEVTSECSESRPSYVSTYLSFASPKPYVPAQTTSINELSKNISHTNSNNLQTFTGSRNASSSSLGSNSGRNKTLEPDCINAVQPLNIFPEIYDKRATANSATNEFSFTSENMPSSEEFYCKLTREKSFLSDFNTSEHLESSAAVFTRETPSSMLTFCTAGNSHTGASSFTISRRLAFSETTASIKSNEVGTDYEKITEEERKLQENKCEGQKTIKNNFDKEKTNKILHIQQSSKAFKDISGDSVFDNTDFIVSNLMEKLRCPISEQRRDKEIIQLSKETLISTTRQFVCDSQILVSNAIQHCEFLVRSIRNSVDTLSTITEHCTITVSAMGPTSQAVMLNNRVIDLTGAFKATVTAARKAVGKPISCTEMKILMKQATSLATIINSLLKLLNRI